MKKYGKWIISTGIALSSLGIIFKIQHWVGASPLLTSGAIFLFLYMFLYYLNPWETSNNDTKYPATVRKEKFNKIIIGIGIGIFILGAFFKIQHWKGAGLMLLVSLTFFFGYFLFVSYKIRKYWFSVISLVFAFDIVLRLFKIQHWGLGLLEIRTILGIVEYLLYILLLIFFYTNRKLIPNDKSFESRMIWLSLSIAFLTLLSFTGYLDLPSIYNFFIFVIGAVVTVYVILLFQRLFKIKLALSVYKAHFEILKLGRLIFFLSVAGQIFSLLLSGGEIMTAYQTVNAGMDRSIELMDDELEALNQKIIPDSIQGDVSQVMQKAIEVNDRSNALVAYIHLLQDSLVYYSNRGSNENVLVEKDLKSVKQLFITNQQGDSLSKRITDLHQFYDSIDSSISTMATDFNTHNNFYMIPAIAAQTVLTKIEQDIRTSQANAINYLLNSIEKKGSVQ